MIIKTGSFGSLEITEQDIITFPLGIHGFPEEKEFCLIDPADDTLILWLQSVRKPELAFAVLEPKIFKSDYTVRLSGAELRELKLENLNNTSVLSILTLPADLQGMSANLKAPLVINLTQKLGRQVVLQENDYNLKHPMFHELRAHLVTMQTQRAREDAAAAPIHSVVHIQDLTPSASVRSLQA